MVYVTHDQTEAMTLGTRVAVMHEGAVQQVAPPMTLYREPANMFVAGFIGSPAMNFVHGHARRRTDEASWRFDGAGLSLSFDTAADLTDRPLVVGVRPQELSIADGAEPNESIAGEWTGAVTLVELLGNEQIVHVATGDVDDIVVVSPASRSLSIGERVSIRIPRAAVHIFDAETGRRLSARDR
jgi:multiple sugar transport system ATP-binding protein